MMNYRLCFALLSGLLLHSASLYAQSITLDNSRLTPNLVTSSFDQVLGEKAIKVLKDSTIRAVDEPTFVRIKGIDFTNGTIEVKVLSRLLKNAPESARGFIGVAFRINEHNTKYESIYIRPTNGRATDQVRRNYTTRYYSYPDYKFDRLRKEAPERYESYADMGLRGCLGLCLKAYFVIPTTGGLFVKRLKNCLLTKIPPVVGMTNRVVLIQPAKS